MRWLGVAALVWATTALAEPTRVVACAVSSACGAHPLGRDGAGAWAALADSQILAQPQAFKVVWWSPQDYAHATSGLDDQARAALVAERTRAADPLSDGWRRVMAGQERLARAAAAISPAAFERALAPLAEGALPAKTALPAMVAEGLRRANELRSLSLLPVARPLADDARAEAARLEAAARDLAAAAHAPLPPPAEVEHVWFVRGGYAPERLPNGSRGPLAFQGGSVGPMPAPPKNDGAGTRATLVWLDPQRFSDLRDGSSPARLQTEVAARVAHGVPAAEGRDYLDERTLIVAIARLALLQDAPANLRALVRRQLDGDEARLRPAVARPPSTLCPLTTAIAADADFVAALAQRQGRASSAATMNRAAEIDRALAPCR